MAYPPPATAVLDAHGVVIGWSEGARRLTGYRLEEVVGRAVTELLAEKVTDEVRRLLARRTSWRGRVAVRHRDGRRVELPVRAHRRSAQEEIGAEWLVVFPATGEQRPRGEAMAQWRFAQSPSLLAFFDTDLRLQWANADWERVVALSTAQMHGLRLPEIVPVPEAEEAERAMLRALRTGERPQDLEQHLRAPGETRGHAWSVSIAPLKDSTGRLRGVWFAGRDHTAQYLAHQRLMLLNEASIRIGTTLDITRTAQELADVAVPRLADCVSVSLLASLDREAEPPTGFLTGPVALRHTAGRGAVENSPQALLALGAEADCLTPSPMTESLTTGRSTVHDVGDASFARGDEHAVSWTDRLREYGFRSAMTVPVLARGATLGVALFLRHRSSEPFEGDDLLLAEEITARAAVCIDNARRYTRERSMAAALKQNLLPQALPDQQAVEAASRCLAAGAEISVGGDWFDLIPLSGARVALVVGDVVGHGIQAAVTMGRLRTAVHTLADLDLPPDELLTHLDDLVIRLSAEESAEESAGDVGATCLYAVYDPISRRCAFASAGHPVPALVAPDGTARLVEMSIGPPLGLGGLPFEATVADLPEGTLLALYTDGLISARDRDVDEGLELLCRTLARPAASLDVVCDTVLNAMLPAHPADDVALLLARTCALDPSQVASWEDLPADPAAVAEARTWTAARLGEWELDDVSFVTELVISELLTNAIRYGRPPISLRLIRNRTLICEVSDASSTAPHMRRARIFDEGGRGLLLVAQLTQRWGTRHARDGKTIWAEQLLPDLAEGP